MSTQLVGVEVLEGKELCVRDASGTSDPFVVLLVEGKKLGRTKVCFKTLNPVWESESFILPVPPTTKALELQVWDKDVFRDDPMGAAHVLLATLTPFNVPRDLWLLLRPTRAGDDPVSGYLHVRCVRFAAAVPPRADEGVFPSPVFAAVRRGDLLLLTTTLQQVGSKLDVNKGDAHGWTPAHWAAAHTQNEHILLTLLRLAPSVRADVRNEDGNTPLHVLCREFDNVSGVVSALEGLFACGADVSSANHIGETPLHLAVLNRALRTLLAEQLILRGANVNSRSHKGATPLHYAAQLGKEDAVALLIEEGADMEQRDDAGRRPVDIAEELGMEHLVQTLHNYAELARYLDSLGLGNFRKGFFQRRLFLKRLRHVTSETLEGIGIKHSEQRTALLDIFASLPSAAPPSPSVVAQTPRMDSVREEDFEFLSFVGEGSTAKVYRSRLHGKVVALKVIEGSTSEERDAFLREFEIIRDVASPNILRHFCVVLPADPSCGRLSIAMEYAERGSLCKLLNDAAFPLTWKHALSFSEQIVRGLWALHGHSPPIFHRDLKSPNILVTTGVSAASLQLKLCDFGLSRYSTADNYETLQQLRGTYTYTSPDALLGLPYTEKSDVFSLGIVIWEIVHRLLSGRYSRPYSEFKLKVDFQVLINVATKDDFRPTIPSSCPSSVRSLIQLCLQRRPESRPSCEELLGLLSEISESYRRTPDVFESCIAK